ncbi:hypothetical protein FOA52_007820 [Chlamydomonas sp. UWO 241]|nr:hypothetical protein FOA52_007820 [Chlamydomonas sp. UWO 241]
MADEGDFSNGFSFDAGDGSGTQAAWEFAGAIAQAGPAVRSGTTIDHKIAKRLDNKVSFGLGAAAAANGKAAAKPPPRGLQPPPKGKSRPSVRFDDDENDDAEADSDDDDEPLAGELDDDYDDDMDDEDDGDDSDVPLPGELEDEDEEEEDDEEEEEEDEEEEEQAAPSKRQRLDAAGAAAAAKPAPAASAKAAAPAKAAPAAKGAAGKAAAAAATAAAEAGTGAGLKRSAPASSSGKGAGGGGSKGNDRGDAGGYYAQTPAGTTFSATSFADLNLSRPLLKACGALGYSTPTPIQAACIPLALSGRDICGSAMTGSGKTAAFALPILERLLHRPKQVAATYVLILTPTRELAVQIHSMVQKLAQYTDVQAALIVGGLSSTVQASVLRKSPEIVVATPGRLIDHLRNTQSVGLEDLAVLVLDEADRLLEMGFKEELQEIIRMTPKKRQTLLFSATLSDQVKKLAALSLRQPVRLAADAAAQVPSHLTQQIVRLKGGAAALKEAHLLAVCSRSFNGGATIVFFKTKQLAHRAKILFGLTGLPPAAELHGDMTQAARLESLERFRTGAAAFLLATDVASRGLDIPGVSYVVNFDAPRRLDAYLHRIGRTARAGASGQAVTFIEDDDRGLLKEVVKKTGVQMQQRMVPAAAVTEWQARIEGHSGDIWRIQKEEREEKDMRKAEMEANKMENMLEHEDEIRARPPKTWFQSEREKKASKERTTAMAAEGRDEQEEDGEGKGRRNKEDRKAAKKTEHTQKRKDEEKAKKRGALVAETEQFSGRIKSVKSKLRKLVESGINPHQAAKMASAEVSGIKRKAKKSEGGGGGGGGKKGGLFSGDGTGRSAGPDGSVGDRDDRGGGGGGAKKAGTVAKGRGGTRTDSGGLEKKLPKSDLNRLKRGGKGKSQFKSKAKFKRR